jgi:hypothetical protein
LLSTVGEEGRVVVVPTGWNLEVLLSVLLTWRVVVLCMCSGLEG